MKYYYVIALIFIGLQLQAQIVDIPDANFKAALISDGVDTNNDGEIQQSEAEAVDIVSVSNESISSLEGIQAFLNMEQLFCESNNLTTIDVSQNTSLRSLWCRFNSLNTLDVTGCSELTTFICSNNFIENIDVTTNPMLAWFDISRNSLSTLDVTQNLDLGLFICHENELTNLDVTQNVNLYRLLVHNNELVDLDMSQNPLLTQISCFGNQLTSLDVTANILLRNLSCSNNTISYLDLSQNPEIDNFECTNVSLTNLDLRNGNNSGIGRMIITDNSPMLCISVDDVSYANAQLCDTSGSGSGWCKDPSAQYSAACILSLEDIPSVSVVLSPNPAKDTLSIWSDFQIDRTRIYTIHGQLIVETAQTTMDISYLNTGIYFAEITAQGLQATKKFIKQ